jgi:hypothetical protein
MLKVSLRTSIMNTVLPDSACLGEHWAEYMADLIKRCE